MSWDNRSALVGARPGGGEFVTEPGEYTTEADAAARREADALNRIEDARGQEPQADPGEAGPETSAAERGLGARDRPRLRAGLAGPGPGLGQPGIPARPRPP
jgi:hypothetical protein